MSMFKVQPGRVEPPEWTSRLVALQFNSHLLILSFPSSTFAPFPSPHTLVASECNSDFWVCALSVDEAELT